MATAELVAAGLTFGPAVALLWFFLGRYEGHFEDARLFFAMGGGLFAGLVARFLETRFFGFEYPAVLQGSGAPFSSGVLVYSFAYTALGYGLVEAFAMGAVLGLRKFRARKDSPYYGTALGLAFGTITSLELLSLALAQNEGHLRTDTFGLVLDAVAVVLAWGLMAAHAAAGAWMGREIGAGKLWRSILFGSLWLAPALGCYWLWLPWTSVPPGLSALLCLAWGVLGLVLADFRVLQRIVPPELRDMVRKERRREQRKRTEP